MKSSALNLLLLLVAFVQLFVDESECCLTNHCNRKRINDLTVHLLHPLRPQRNQPTYAVCTVNPSNTLRSDQPAITGRVLFKQGHPTSTVEGFINLSGFLRHQSLHAIHVHKFGDLTDGCTSTGPHYNPNGVNHPLHPGDFNNFATKSGKIVQSLSNLQVTLFGSRSILGRAVVVHAGEDDLGTGGNEGSLLHGNSGARLACCTIGLSKADLWDATVHQ
uniref:Superoxide dismutase [Cu-Zn] n=1 Tax=Callorhinchus milii TaxID=7868 RepID=K4G9Y1_CALMI|nr:extracellular superoxide dismutase [Callorhinchus milii]